MIPVQTYTSAADMRAAHSAIRARLYGNPSKPEPVKVEPAKIETAQLVYTRVVRGWHVQQDSHVTAWKFATYKARIKSLEMSLKNREEIIQRMVGDGDIPAQPRVSALDACKATLAECAAKGEGNFSMSEILGHRRVRALVHVRHKCIAAVAANCSHLSYTQIGRFFNRDHSSIMWAAQKMGVLR
jgi:chromosomal replication initiation ATPase DnaA